MGEIRILRVVARMNVGGPALEIAELMRNLPRQDFKQLLVTGNCDQNEQDFLEVAGKDIDALRIAGLGRRVNPLGDVRTLFALMRVIRDFRPHIVHTHTTKAGVLGRIAATLSPGSAKIVHTYHGHLLHGYFGGWKLRALVSAEKLLAARTALIVTVGSAVRNDLMKVGIGTRSKWKVIPPGVRASHLTLIDKQQAKVALGIGSEEYVMCFVGRLEQIKRPDRLADLLVQLEASGIRFTFLVAGSGTMEVMLRERAKNLKSSIQFLGWVTNIGEILSASDALILTSDNEGTPISLIEAALAGIPAISTDVGSVSEVVIDGVTGLLTAPSVSELLEKTLYLHHNREAAIAMGEEAVKWANEQFSPDRFLTAHASSYREILDAPK